jgi:DNA topoisomerase-1
MDIVRLNTNGRFRYINKKSRKKIHDRHLPRIQSLKIPPAYHRVRISYDPKSKVQAIGLDDMNRKQYVYHPNHLEESRELKFTDLINFGRKIKRIRKEMNNSIVNFVNSGQRLPTRDDVINLVLFLIDKCNFRVGCDKYKKLYNTYGATTLNKRHLDFKNKCIDIEFLGKKGVTNKSRITHPTCIRFLSKMSDIYGHNEYLFCYQDSQNNTHRINESQINSYLKKFHKNISVKMFRTWAANHILLKKLLEYQLPENVNQANKNVREAIKKAAEQMHHTRNVSKKSYMNNEFIDMYLNKPQEFGTIILSFKKANNKLPTTDRILNLFLTLLKKRNLSKKMNIEEKTKGSKKKKRTKK